jgi:hypothetical protein
MLQLVNTYTPCHFKFTQKYPKELLKDFLKQSEQFPRDSQGNR